MCQNPEPSHSASHEGTNGTSAETPSATRAVGDFADALEGVGRQLASARSHLRLAEECFQQGESALLQARGLLRAERPQQVPAVPPASKCLAPAVRVTMLGAFKATIDSVQVTDWKGSKSRALFIYLVSHRQMRVPREQLLDALWAGADTEAAANSLRVAVHGLRLATGSVTGASRDSLVMFEKGGYLLNPLADFQVDNEEFERHWSRARRLERAGESSAAMQAYEQAEAVYLGDFLQEEPYEEWAMLRREGLKDMYLSVLSRLSARAFAHGDYEGCIHRCQKLIDADSCREDTYQLLIRCHLKLGQPGRARRWYDICVRVLRDELDVGPSRQTVAAYEEIGMTYDKAS